MVNLTGAITQKTKIEGTFSYLDAGGEQTVVSITSANPKLLGGIWLDLVNMTENGTIRAYYEIDGTNSRQFLEETFTVATDDDGIYLNLNCAIDNDFLISYEEAVDEGADRAVPYQIIYI